MPHQTRLGLLPGLVVLCWLGASGCAGLSGGLGLKYKPDDVDDFHANSLALRDSVVKIHERLANIRGRLGAVARGQLSTEAVAGDIRRPIWTRTRR